MTCIEKREYYEIIYDILKSDEFQKRKNYKHHGNISVYDHSISVSKMSYYIAKKFNLDYKSAAIGGLLHDFYSDPWQLKPKSAKLLKAHGFTHAKEALSNAHKYFPELMNKKVDNIILRHMFPLNKMPPKCKEGWVITIVDKYVACEVFKNPKSLPSLIGVRRKPGEV